MRHAILSLALISSLALGSGGTSIGGGGGGGTWGSITGNTAQALPSGGFTGSALFSGQLKDTKTGAASTPSLWLTGAPYAAGSATTNKPLTLLENASTSNNWSSAGTYLGINAATGFTGDYIRAQLEGVNIYIVRASVAGTFAMSGGPALFLGTHNGTGNYGAFWDDSSGAYAFSTGAHLWDGVGNTYSIGVDNEGKNSPWKNAYIGTGGVKLGYTGHAVIGSHLPAGPIDVTDTTDSTHYYGVGATGVVSQNTTKTTVNGSAGTAICSQPATGDAQTVVCYLSGFTGDNSQTYTFPTAFSHTPAIVYAGAGITPSVSTTTAGFTSTTATGYVILMGN